MIALEIAEFGERLDEFIECDDLVVINDKGVELATYFSQRCATNLEKARMAAEAFARTDQELRRRGIDLDKQLVTFGLRHDGELHDA